MAPVCQAEDSLSAHFDDLLARQVEAEVGLLIGRNGCAKRDLVMMLVPTPQHEDQAPISFHSSKNTTSSKKAGKQADQATLATDCIVDHAAQVAAMMPGGLTVGGIYLYGPESIFSPLTQQLSKVLDGVASSPGSEANKLLFVASSGRRFLCKHRPAGTASNATLPICTFTLAPVLASMSCIACRHHIHIDLPCISSQQTLAEQLEAAASAECQRIQLGTGIIQGKAASSTLTVANLTDDSSSDVDLLCPPVACRSPDIQPGQQSVVTGRLLLTGTMHARAIVNKKATLATVIDLIKTDLVNSLQARLDIVLAEADEDTGAIDKPLSLSSNISEGLPAFDQQLPRRVFFPVKGCLILNDYLGRGELASDAAARVERLLGPGIANYAQAETPESQGLTEQPHLSGVWDPYQPHAQLRQAAAKSLWASRCNMAVIASSALVALTAALSMLYTNRKS